MSGLTDLRALCRYQTHGGYVWAAVMDDGETVCTPCVRANYRQVFTSTKTEAADGWQCVGLDSAADSEDAAHCAHCNKEIWGAK